VTKEDVYMMLDLSKFPVEVIEAKNETNVNVEFKCLLRHWKEQWPDRDSVPKCAKMVAMMESQADGGEDSKQNVTTCVVPSRFSI